MQKRTRGCGLAGAGAGAVRVGMDGGLVELIDRARGQIGRSQWIRDAVVAALRSSGVAVPQRLRFSSPRKNR